LLDLFVEGFVPLETLDPEADYNFRATTRSFVPGRRAGRSRAPALRLGDSVSVRVDRIDSMRKQVQFSLLGVVAKRR